MDIDLTKYDNCDLVTIFEQIVIEMRSRYINIYNYIPSDIKNNDNKESTNYDNSYDESLGYY
uniref:Uncharacterized protein n=1 Tax=Borely moumouvirus TaxID=2712067 RepID=A0A6G6ABY1_9VIRU